MKKLAHELWEYGSVDVLAHSELIKFSKKKKPSFYLTSFIKPLKLSEKHTDTLYKVHRKGLESLQKISVPNTFSHDLHSTYWLLWQKEVYMWVIFRVLHHLL